MERAKQNKGGGFNPMALGAAIAGLWKLAFARSQDSHGPGKGRDWFHRRSAGRGAPYSRVRQPEAEAAAQGRNQRQARASERARKLATHRMKVKAARRARGLGYRPGKAQVA